MGHAMNRNQSSQSGFAMVIILGLLMVLTIMGSVAVHSVRGEVSHTGRESNHARAQMVAESAINWSLGVLAIARPNTLAFTAATHASNGTDLLPDNLENGVTNNRKLHPSEVIPIYPTQVKADNDGWIYQETLDNKVSLTGATSESIAFKVWFPNDSTIRISGKGMVLGITSQVEMTGTLKYAAAVLK
jgi:Tfp pilus assembly protein PilX